MSIGLGEGLAIYAAGLSTFLGVQQVLLELPSVRVHARTKAKLVWPVTNATHDVSWVTVTNAGRRPVIISQVFFVDTEGYWASPQKWIYGHEVPFPLSEGEGKHLLLEPGTENLPDDPDFIAVDTLGRLWPRRIRWMRRLRRIRPRFRRPEDAAAGS